MHAPEPTRSTHAHPPSVLHPPGASEAEVTTPPAYFADLHLDGVVAAVTKGREPYDLRPLFHARVRDEDAITFRHEVFRDLADERLRDEIVAFSSAMRRRNTRSRRATVARNPLRSQRLVLDGASTYCAAVVALTDALGRARPASRALRDVAAYLGAYTGSAGFRALHDDVRRLEHDLAAVAYELTLREDRVVVRRADAQDDYGVDVERTFRTFRRRTPPERSADAGDASDMNHVEAAVLALVARLHPRVFDALAAFAARHTAIVDPVIARFEREVQFYLAYLEHVRRVERAGLRFCLPTISTTGAVLVRDTYDLALAGTLVAEGGTVVTNEVRLDPSERIVVVTGANQGGKSTFARTFGQLHHLAALGCPVPGSEATLLAFDEVLTHFEREESLGTLQGKLHEELTRLRALVDRATPDSIVIMNESFSSTATDDALELGRETITRLLDIGARAVYVTFIDELSTFDARIASVTATVDPHDPARRTFELVRRPADGRAHAVAIARAHGLTYDTLRLRLQR